jgi:hypothetical protein
LKNSYHSRANRGFSLIEALAFLACLFLLTLLILSGLKLDWPASTIFNEPDVPESIPAIIDEPFKG